MLFRPCCTFELKWMMEFMVPKILLLLIFPTFSMAANSFELGQLFPSREVIVKQPEALTYSEDDQPGRKRAIRKGRKAHARKEYRDALQWFELAVNIKGGSAIAMY